MEKPAALLKGSVW